MTIKRILAMLLAAVLIFTTACESNLGITDDMTPNGTHEPTSAATTKEVTTEPQTEVQTEAQSEKSTVVPSTDQQETTPEITEALPDPDVAVPELGGYYYDVINVVLYLDIYGELPPNFITKNEARELGWQGGSVEDFYEGGAIGGDRFGNYEGILPKEKGRNYTECDIDTYMSRVRGSKRLVFSNDGLYFYTEDHYETFAQVFVTEDYEVTW